MPFINQVHYPILNDMELAEIQDLLQRHHIHYVRLCWCDNANIIRAKSFHVNRLAECYQYGLEATPALQAVPATADKVIPEAGLPPVGSVWLYPAWRSIRFLPFCDHVATVMCNIHQNQKPWSQCPRSFLQRMNHHLHQATGLMLQASFENEFYLLKPDEKFPSASDDSLFASTYSMNQHHEFIVNLTEMLERQGVQVENYYPESGCGQQEMSIRYRPALVAADQQLIYRETVHAVAKQHGFAACFLPKIFKDQAGNGCHIHFSLWDGDANIISHCHDESGLSDTAQAFLAGVLHHLPSLMAITTPTTNSFRRLGPDNWSGAYQVWGIDNREAALRVPSEADGSHPTHIELKTIDATANPYLALGALIACGLDGIENKMPLSKPLQAVPSELSYKAKRALQVKRLPKDLATVLKQLQHNTVLNNALGPELMRSYHAVKYMEYKTLKPMTLTQEAKLLRTRY